MREMRKTKVKRTVWPYIQAIPEIIVYEAVSKLILLGLAFLLKKLMMWAIYQTGRVAVTSGDFAFLFTSPYGWIVILTSLILVGIYIAFDINVIVNYAGEKVKERPTVLWKIVLESLTESARFFTPGGLLVLFYATLIAPVIGVGMTTSLTKGLYVPNFITDVIRSTPSYNIMYSLFVVVMIVIGILGMFTIHGMVIDHISPIKAYVRSVQMCHRHYKDLIKQLFLFFLKYALVDLTVSLALLTFPLLIRLLLGNISVYAERFFIIVILLFFTIILFSSVSLLLPLLTMKITQLYYQYNEDIPMALKTRPAESYKQMIIVIAAAYLLCWGVSFFVQENFEMFFTRDVYTEIIGHRGAGNEGTENTISGIRKAIDLGCYGTEIDVQRTSDGYYILNHDNTFKRVADVNSAPSEMTLREIKALRIKDAPGERVPTIEEALDAARGKIIMFIELKGSTADQKMCDDMVRLLKERNMVNSCVLISLKYDLVEYIEDNYPEINTGFLAFITLGNVGELKCDYLGLEEEAATSAAIDAAHEHGRKVIVWTPNSTDSQKRFLLSKADAIITDQATQAGNILGELELRDDPSIIIDSMVNYLF